jgi:hypothetical protein
MPYHPATVAVAPKTHGCSCSTGNGLFPCKRYAVVRVGRTFYCRQHAEARGIIPTTEAA